jgi:hypothetical protein
MPNRVDTAVDREQHPPLKPPLDRPLPDSKFKKLPAPNHPMLPLRQLAQNTIYLTNPAFAPHRVVNAGLVGHEADGGRPGRVCGARIVRDL